MAWIFLGQGLPAYAVAGIALVTGGVLWVVSQDAAKTFKLKSADYSKRLVDSRGRGDWDGNFIRIDVRRRF